MINPPAKRTNLCFLSFLVTSQKKIWKNPQKILTKKHQNPSSHTFVTMENGGCGHEVAQGKAAIGSGCQEIIGKQKKRRIGHELKKKFASPI